MSVTEVNQRKLPLSAQNGSISEQNGHSDLTSSRSKAVDAAAKANGSESVDRPKLQSSRSVHELPHHDV